MASAWALRQVPTPPPMGYAHDDVLPDCSCKCCTAEVCQCDTNELVCMTDKRQECNNWVGANMEVRDCNPELAWNQWRAANPFDVKFLKPNTRMKHDDFCADYCKPTMEIENSGCSWIPPPQPQPTRPPDCSHCPCAAGIPNATAPAPPFFLQQRQSGCDACGC